MRRRLLRPLQRLFGSVDINLAGMLRRVDKNLDSVIDHLGKAGACNSRDLLAGFRYNFRSPGYQGNNYIFMVGLLCVAPVRGRKVDKSGPSLVENLAAGKQLKAKCGYFSHTYRPPVFSCSVFS